MGKWPMSPICTLLWHNLRFSWMQPLFKHSATRKKEKEPKRKNKFSRNEQKAIGSVIRCICHVIWNLRGVKFLMYCITMRPTCCCICHCSGWSETETVTVGSSAHGRRGSRCAARMGGAMRPAVNCRGHAAKIKHWHCHTAAGVEVRTGYSLCTVCYEEWRRATSQEAFKEKSLTVDKCVLSHCIFYHISPASRAPGKVLQCKNILYDLQ